jgi:hypothetical protein
MELIKNGSEKQMVYEEYEIERETRRAIKNARRDQAVNDEGLVIEDPACIRCGKEVGQKRTGLCFNCFIGGKSGMRT